MARVDGEDGKKAKAIIEKENPQVTGVIMAPGTSYILDTCCNRVLIWVDDKGNTLGVPMLG